MNRAVVKTSLLVCLLSFYCIFFFFQEKQRSVTSLQLNRALPATFYKIVAGYGKQLVSEMLFVRTSIFLGQVRRDGQSESYEVLLANNLDVMTSLYPRFLDPYFYTNSFLTYLSKDSAGRATKIFEKGITAHPQNVVLRFFHASNFFLNLDQPTKAAQAFSEAAKIPDAPPMFEHLAALLKAEGGDIAAGLLSLRAMLATEDNEVFRERYEMEIKEFEKALDVQGAINAYIKKNGNPPESLEKLVPQFLEILPVLEQSFHFKYNPPTLHLKREKR